MRAQNIYDKITQSMGDFQSRNSQLQMIEVMDNCFGAIVPDQQDGHNICLIEAPTGTGKSLAYLIAGIYNAQKHAKKFVISTATKTLQGQLFNKDIPNFIKHSGYKFIYGLAKGRSNYLCPYQLEISMVEAGGDLLKQTDKITGNLEKIMKLYNKRTWDGDLDNAPIYIDNKLKPLITIDRHQCLNYSCPHNQKDDSNCPFYKNRDFLRNCDVIITNHSLLLADFNNGGGVILPVKPEEYYLCIDEAHSFANYAISGFMGQFELKYTIGILNNLAKFLYNPLTESYIYSENNLCEELAAKTLELSQALEEFLVIMKANLDAFQNNILILNDYLNNLINQTTKDFFINFAFLASEITDGCTKIHDKLKEQLKNDSTIETNLSKLGYYINIIDTVMSTSNYLINMDDSRYNANAKWVEYRLNRNNEEFIIVAGVTHVGNLLYNKIWSKIYAATLTSATLAIGDSFNYLKLQLGLNLLPNVINVKLATTFDYVNQSQLVIPQFKYAPEYTTRNEFNQELIKYLSYILAYRNPYGTLVLFYNRQQLLDIYDKLPMAIQKKILLQTEYVSNQKLITDHKKYIDEDLNSIIFGLNSFAEGVDLPSLYCMHVIITKLPFETHKDPQNMVREYWVKAENGNYFMDISVPETCIKLIQAVGRLIRSENDYGQITICDNRIATKQYGKLFLDALPEFNRNYNRDFIKDAFNKIKP